MSNKQFSFDDFFSTQLNAQQQEIVQARDGVLLVCAGAGSGKTRIITARMTHLIVKHNVIPSSIVALTFTNKAAREMKERMTSFLQSKHQLPYVGTFHSYCVRLLKNNNHLLRVKDFSILDGNDQEKLIKMILNRHNVHKKISPKQLLNTISQLKNEAVTGDLPLHLVPDPFLRTLILAYEREKTASQCLDFDDLLLETVRLINTSTSFKEMYQNHVRHLLVDEYQDTNKVQHVLLQGLTCNSMGLFTLDSLCVVGDEDQSIYSWRGATVSNIVYFKRDFPTVRSFTIEQNYRSVQPILHLANNIIVKNKERNPKRLWSERIGHDRIRLINCSSGYQEADFIATFADLYSKIEPTHSCAVLYRSHYQSRSIEEALLRQGIPYRIIGGIQFYERQEIKDLIAYLRLITNPFDRISFSRVYNVPSRGLGEKFLELFLEEWDKQPFLNYRDLAQYLIAQSHVTGAKARSLEQFIAVSESLTSKDKPATALEHIIRAVSYFSYLRENFDEEEAISKTENVKELINAIRAYEDRTENITIELFLEEVALLQETLAQPQENTVCIQLMTMHAAKGLEFDAVIIAGAEEQILPSAHAIAEGNLEEERRLLYVGITRARERLVIVNARMRHTYGSLSEQRLSRFIQELGSDAMIQQDIVSWGIMQCKSYLTQWIQASKLGLQPSVKASQILRWEEDPFKQSAPASVTGWLPKQQIVHATFGPGIIENVEVRSAEQVFLTIAFGRERKRIDSKFVKRAS